MKKLYALALVLVLILSGCSSEESSDTTTEVSGEAKTYDVSKFKEYKLESVIDGDTIRIDYDGKSEKVRFLLVDTPETNHETLGEQPFGPEAKEFTKNLLEGEDTVYLEFDVSSRDKYQRLLAYIYTKDGVSIQEELLRNGYARVAYIYDPNTKHVDWFKDVQENAQKQAVGIWSVEDYVTNRGYDKEAFKTNKKVEPQEDVSSNVENKNTTSKTTDGCAIKGNINAKGNKTYFMEGHANYEQVKEEELFCSEQEAQKAGFKAAS